MKKKCFFKCFRELTLLYELCKLYKLCKLYELRKLYELGIYMFYELLKIT